jgi:cytochrome c oxidase assembly protein subunit 15
MCAMPFDDRDHPPTGPGLTETVLRNRRLVSGWLFAVGFMILIMIVLGGTTRLTGSGLSIMEWDPVSGILPPLSHAEWERLYRLYKQIPQYSLVNDGFGLAGFQRIFWLEWVHRLWGRLMGVVFFVPLVWLWWRGAIERSLLPRLVGFFLLGGLQGAVGWFMVSSGFFADSTAVAPSRLVVHLALALVLYAAIIWTAMSVRRPVAEGGHPAWLRRMAGATLALVALTIVAGGYVAGLHAGLAYNTFPLMDGHLVPASYASLTPFWRNITHNIAAVQFDHRLLATLTAVLALLTAGLGFVRSRSRGARLAFLALGAALCVQYALGVATLLSVVAIPLAAAHQLVAALLLTAALVVVHVLRRRNVSSVQDFSP